MPARRLCLPSSLLAAAIVAAAAQDAAARDNRVFPGRGWKPVEFGEPSTNLVGVRAHLEELGAWNQTAWEAAEEAARTSPPATVEPDKFPADVHAGRWLELADASDDPDAGLGNALPRAARERFRLLLRLLPEESEWPRVRAALDENPRDDPGEATPVRDALRLALAVLADDAPATEAALARFPVVLEGPPDQGPRPVPDIEAFLSIPEDEARSRMDDASAAFLAEMALGGDDRFARWSTNRMAAWWPGAVSAWLEREREAALDRDNLPLAERIQDRLEGFGRRPNGGPDPELVATFARANFLETRVLPGRKGSGHDLPYWDAFAGVCFELGQTNRPFETIDRLIPDPATDADRLRKEQIRALVEFRRTMRTDTDFKEKSRAFAAYQDAKSAADATDAFWGYDLFGRVFVKWCEAAEKDLRLNPDARDMVLAMRPRCRAALAWRNLGPQRFESDRDLALAYVAVLEAAGALDEAERLLWDSIGRAPAAWDHDALVPLWSFYLRNGRAREVADFVEGCTDWAGKDPVGRDAYGGGAQTDVLLLSAFHALGRTNATARIARHFGFDAGGGIGGVPDDADVVRLLQDFALEREARAVAAAAGLPEPTPRPPWQWKPEDLVRWRVDVKHDLARAAAAPPRPVPPIIPGTEPHDRYPSAVTKPAGLPPRFDGLFARRPVAVFDSWWIGWTRRAEELVEKRSAPIQTMAEP